MSIEWWHLILGFVGTNGVTYYFARPKKKSIEIENMKKVIDEMQEERENTKKLYSSYEEKTDAKIKELEDKLINMERKNTAMLRAINTAYRCTLTADIHGCPVLKTLEDECPNEVKSCKI